MRFIRFSELHRRPPAGRRPTAQRRVQGPSLGDPALGEIGKKPLVVWGSGGARQLHTFKRVLAAFSGIGGHDPAPVRSGGSATSLSGTGAWAKPQPVMATIMRLVSVNSKMDQIAPAGAASESSKVADRGGS
jgi:hypothetical protein